MNPGKAEPYISIGMKVSDLHLQLNGAGILLTNITTMYKTSVKIEKKLLENLYTNISTLCVNIAKSLNISWNPNEGMLIHPVPEDVIVPVIIKVTAPVASTIKVEEPPPPPITQA